MFKMNAVGRGGKLTLQKGGAMGRAHPVKQLLYLVQELSERADGAQPEICRSSDKTCLRVLFSTLSLDVDEFLSCCGILAGNVAECCGLSINGFIAELKEGRVDVDASGEQYCFAKSSTTGENFEVLYPVYLRLDFADAMETGFFCDLLRGFSPDCCTVALHRRWDNVVAAQGLYENSEVSYYRYVYAGDDPGEFPGTIPYALSLEQIAGLWQSYLEDGAPWNEFEQTLALIEEGGFVRLYKWQLGLKIAAESMGLSITAQPARFQIVNREGKRLSVGYNGTAGAEKLLAKLIFPA